MSNTTTVKVQTSTRDRLAAVGVARRLTADQVIVSALEAMERDELRKRAAAEALAFRDDPDEIAEIRAIQEDMAALHAR